MSSSFCRKLHALIKKNLILMKRNIIRTFFEIFFPILMLIIIFEVRKSFKIEKLTFEAAEKNISNFISNHSILTSLDRDNGLEFNNPKNESLDDLIDFISEKMNLNDIDFEKKDFNDFNFSQHNISMYIEEYIKKMNKKQIQVILVIHMI